MPEDTGKVDGLAPSKAGDPAAEARRAAKDEGRGRPTHNIPPDSGTLRDITLEGERDITIYGSVIPGNGTSGTNQTGNTSLIGTNGGRGGHITIHWEALGALTLASGALLQTGSGGAGASALSIVDEGSPSIITTCGGYGGDSGTINLDGAIR